MRWPIGGLLGCATMIAIAAFVVGLIGSLFAATASPGERLLIAVGVAATAFVAALILAVRDFSRHRSTVKAVRRMLLARKDIAEADFASHFPDIDPALLGQIRQVIADFFHVPATKVHPGDNPRGHLQCDILEPSFHTFITYHTFYARKVVANPGRIITFNSSALNSLKDLINELQRILDSFDSGRAKSGD